MDYAKLAAQFGGAPVKEQEPETPDYAALAAQFGGEALVGGKPETGFIPSVKRGYAGLETLTTDVLPAMVGKAFGANEYAEKKMQEAALAQEEASRKYPAEIPSYTDIKSVGDAITYAKEAVGEAVPTLLPSLFTGGAASVLGRGAILTAQAAAEKAALSAATQGIVGEELKQAAVQAGLKAARNTALKYEAAGALVGSAAQNIPDVYQNIYEKTGQQDLGAAIAFGGFNAVLDAVTPINLLRKAKKAGISPEELGAAWYKRAGKGAVEGLVTEGGTEALQEISSAAAEKFVDSNQEFFTKDNFVRFVDAGLKGGLGGGAITGGTHVLFGKGPEKARTTQDQRQTILDSLTHGMEEPAGLFGDLEGGQPVNQPAGEESQRDKWADRVELDRNTKTVSTKYGDADETLPSSNEPPGLFHDVDTGATTTATPSAPATPSAEATKSLDAYNDFVRQYTELRDEYNSLPQGRIDQAGMNQRELILKDLSQVIDANMNLIGNKGVAAQLKNPMFDGSKVLAGLEPNVGQPRAMQGNLFGIFQGAARRMRNALALSGQSVEGAIQELETSRARLQEKVDSGGYDDATIISMRPAGMTAGQALKNRDSIIQNYTQNANAEIDQAIDNLRRGVGQPRAMQGELFDNEKIQKENADVMRERRAVEATEQPKVTEPTAAPTSDIDEAVDTQATETLRQGVAPGERFEKAPAVDTEHVVQTEEGGKIKGFFDSIQSISESPAEQERHGNSKNTAADTMLEFDIAQPGETTSAGSQQMLDYLARRVGGKEKLDALLDALKGADPETQADLFRKAGLPDLTTRRGMDEFSAQVQSYVDQMLATGEGPLSAIRTSKMRPSQITGTKIPYKETITTGAKVTSVYGTPQGGKPRRPSQSVREVIRELSDNKLRPAALILKQMMGSKVSAPVQAAITYLTNRNRATFGDALRDLAFDLAYFEIDPKHYGANSTFYKEGGKYAQDFRAWIAANLDPSTLQLLDELVAENKQNAVEAEKFEKAVSNYNESLDREAEKKRQEAEKNGAKLPKAPRRKSTAKERLSKMQEEAETEVGEGEETVEPFTEVNLKNLPTVQMLTEVHPAIRRLLVEGKTRKALELLAQAKGNKYYAELAQRLLDTGFTAETRMIDVDTLESLSNDPKITESLNERLNALRDLVVTLYPQEQQAEIIDGLKSGKLRNLVFAIETMQDTLDKHGGTESNQMLLDSVAKLVNEQFAWNGKYDPATDKIVMRQGAGKLTNHLLLHETLHAAASHLLDNADKLVGVQRQGYERLNELYEYSKNMFSQKGVDLSTVYGLQDIHEFLSEALTNPEFQAILRSIRYKASPFSLSNRFTEAIKKLFNVKNDGTSNVMVEAMLAADAMMAGTMSLEGINVAGGTITGPPAPRAMATRGPRRRTTVPPGMPNQPSTIKRWMMADTWNSGKIRELRSLDATARVAYLGALTLRQIDDLVGGRLPQIKNFINVTEKFLARKSQILKESGDISRKWERLQSADPEMSRKLGAVMHGATILEIDPDKPTRAQRINNAGLMNQWRALSPEAKTIYREVRDFYERRYSQYKRLMNRRIITMRQLGVSEATITEIRNEFEKGKRAGPYFPLMRFGRFWYQVGKGANREYYMFESAGARDAHLAERLKQSPHLASTVGENIGNDYKKQMDFHARESAFLKAAFNGIDSMDITGLSPADADKRRTELKDNLYQTYLANQPDRSMRNAFIHRNSIAGYSEDALRSFASSSFSMAYQMARFEYSPEMFSQLDAARAQIKGRFTPGASYDPALVAENDELRDYVGEVDKRLVAMLNPTDTGKWTSYFSNIGFIYYLTSIGSAVVNVMGGAMIGIPTLVGQQVRANPNMGYTEATGRVLYNTFKTMAQIMSTGFDLEVGERILDYKLLSPSFDRSTTMSAVDKAAYNRFVADGLIDITAAYDQSGLASNPTSEYNSIPNRAMQVVAYAFHHAERFNREIVAMSAFRSAMEKRANYTNKQQAFAEAIAEAKDLTNRSMFDYSATNKPRFLQNAVSKIIFQFKQFPQQMTWFIARNAWNSFGNLPEAEKREARARFVGIMGMAAIFSGVTGLFGFSTVAAIINAAAHFGAGDDEPPFDFELEFANWAVNTFGKNMGTMVSRGIGNAAGVDLHSRLSLDGMWFRDGRQNQDAESAMEAFLAGLLGPSAGLTVSAARAYDLYNKGHADRAIETILPGFVKQPVIAARYAREGATTLSGDIMKKEFTPFELMMQSLGLRPADLAEIQFRNIKVKGQEQEILKSRNNILNIFGLTFMTNDVKGNQKAFDMIMKFNNKYPSMAIDAETLIHSIDGKLKKSAQADHGLYIDPKLRYLFSDTYINKLTEKPAAAQPAIDYDALARQHGGELVK